MPPQPGWVISNEILECAKFCLNADDSKTAATEVMQQLLARGWAQEDVEQVIRGAFSVLAHLKSLDDPQHETLPQAE